MRPAGAKRRWPRSRAALVEPGVRIVSSPRQRALDTARVIARATEARGSTVDKRWQEVDVGAAEGLTFDEIGVRWPDLAAQLASGERDIAWPDGDPAGALGRADHGRLVGAPGRGRDDGRRDARRSDRDCSGPRAGFRRAPTLRRAGCVRPAPARGLRLGDRSQRVSWAVSDRKTPLRRAPRSHRPWPPHRRSPA